MVEFSAFRPGSAPVPLLFLKSAPSLLPFPPPRSLPAPCPHLAKPAPSATPPLSSPAPSPRWSRSVSVPTARAAILYWDSDGQQNGTLGGTGTWDLNTTPNFSTTADNNTGTESVWTDTTGTADVASFGGTAGAVTLNTSLGALGLVFSTPGYTISGTGTLKSGSKRLGRERDSLQARQPSAMR